MASVVLDTVTAESLRALVVIALDSRFEAPMPLAAIFALFKFPDWRVYKSSTTRFTELANAIVPDTSEKALVMTAIITP